MDTLELHRGGRQLAPQNVDDIHTSWASWRASYQWWVDDDNEDILCHEGLVRFVKVPRSATTLWIRPLKRHSAEAVAFRPTNDLYDQWDFCAPKGTMINVATTYEFDEWLIEQHKAGARYLKAYYAES